MANKPAKRKQLPKFVSFPGRFKFPKFNDVDYGTEEYPKPNGEFSVKLIGNPKDKIVKAMIAKLEPLHKEAVATAKEKFKGLKAQHKAKLKKANGASGIQINDLYGEVYDNETEEPTGEIEFRFAMTYSGKYKKGPKKGKTWRRKPAIFDATGTTPLKHPPEVWGGTLGKVSFEASPYFIEGTGIAGVKLHLQAVRILELVGPGERDAAAYGFGDEDEGYAHKDEKPAKDEDEDEESEDEDTEDEDESGAEDDEDENPDF